jgi:hypothetical protein
MTSSATPTDDEATAAPDADAPARDPRGLHERLAALPGEHPVAFWLVVLTASGWLLVGYVNRWYFGAPMVALMGAWLGILLGGRFLWRAADTAGREGEATGDDGFAGPTRREDLEAEKRSLLKAIKEVEFDREMGKLSAADADEIIRLYRARAIAILRELEDADGQPLDPTTMVERELRARMLLAKVGGGAKKKQAEPQQAEPAGGDAGAVADDAGEGKA